MELYRYESDPRSIPILGDGNGVVRLAPDTHFSVAEGTLAVGGASGERMNIGSHMQYRINSA